MTPRRASGFTMIEMLVAVGILGIVVAGALETFVVQNKAYTVVDETTEAQQNLRAIAYLIERDLRSTGFMVEEGAAVCGIDSPNAPDTLFVTDTEPINPDNATTATLGATVSGGYGSNAADEKWLVVDDIVIDRDAGVNAGFFDIDGPNDSDFQVGRGAILVDTSNLSRGTACGSITDVDTAGNRVRVEFINGINVTPGDTLVLVPAVEYTIEVDGVTGTSILMRNGMALATDVEDLQVAYLIDSDVDGQDDANEYRGDGTSPDYDSDGTNHANLREVRFNIVVRSRNTDPAYIEGFEQATENRAAAGVNDGFRRRVFTSTVRPRNVGYRGVQASG